MDSINFMKQLEGERQLQRGPSCFHFKYSRIDPSLELSHLQYNLSKRNPPLEKPGLLDNSLGLRLCIVIQVLPIGRSLSNKLALEEAPL